jgi:hypothetical protein
MEDVMGGLNAVKGEERSGMKIVWDWEWTRVRACEICPYLEVRFRETVWTLLVWEQMWDGMDLN